MPDHDKIVFVTRKTSLEELIERMNTRAQAKFYIKHRGGSIEAEESAHERYNAARDRLKAATPRGVRTQWIDRAFLPTYTFGPLDLVVTLGPDGLVINTAKYLSGQPVAAFNPDPERIDGVLLPFQAEDDPAAVLLAAVNDQLPVSDVTMAIAKLDDGQVLYAVNDFFIGHRSHVSARYRISHRGHSEDQSSSGIIVSTGAGSTGWLRSMFAGAAGLAESFASNRAKEELRELRSRNRFDRESKELRFVVREPFETKVTGAEIVFGQIEQGEELEVVSQMPQNGVIFSDGIEADFLEFPSGATTRIRASERTLRLLRPASFFE
jgi:NAD kinase